MKTLFISTYSEIITIGLLIDGKVLDQKQSIANKNHSIYTVPLIDEILKENNLKPDALKEIIVIDGPGSFTGVRLGITVAKMLAYTLNITIKTISSIEALAISNDIKNKIVIISDSKGKYFGIFTNNKLEDELSYLNNEDFTLMVNKDKYKDYTQLELKELDLEKIYEYSKKIKEINPHAVKARYVKEINYNGL